LRIDEELIEKAHDLGLNVSRISENAIKEAIEKMEAKA
jgi:post-segregation antitoxin (ccd killing protein)